MALFDAASIDYDVTFTNSHVGKLVRTTVWELLSEFVGSSPLDILEINCGTGEDAIFLAGKGHKVTATDISTGMIETAKSKSSVNNPRFLALDFNALPLYFGSASFDIVFSDFGGLNCIDQDQLTAILEDIYQILRPGGKFIGVIMGNCCIWEMAYYSIKGRFKTAFRRLNAHKGVKTTMGNESFITYYYSPKQFEKLAPPKLKYLRAYPVGLFIPPSYMDGYFRKHLKQLDILSNLDKRFARSERMAALSDHFIIVLEKTI